MSHRTGDIIADVITTHTYDPDSTTARPVCSCGAEPLDGLPQHVARMVQHSIACKSVPHLSDTKIRVLAGDFAYEELQTLAVSGVDAFDLLRVVVEQDIEIYDRAASNATVTGSRG